MSDTAYLCVWLDGDKVVSAGIYSAPPWGLTTMGRRVAVLLYRIQGSSFHDAHEEMLRVLETMHADHPVKALWDKFQDLKIPNRICMFCGDTREPEIDHMDCCDRKVTGYDVNNGPVYWATCQRCRAQGPITSWAADAAPMFWGEMDPLKQEEGDPK